MKTLLGICASVAVLTLVAWVGLPLLPRRSQGADLYRVSIVIPDGYIGSFPVSASEPPSKDNNVVLHARGSKLTAPSDLFSRGFTLHEVWTETRKPVPLRPVRVGEYGFLGTESVSDGIRFRFGAVSPFSYEK